MPAIVPKNLAHETPLEYMLRVINDPNTDDLRRDRLAVAAAPYLHPKAGEAGKKEIKQDAAKAVGQAGRFRRTSEPKSDMHRLN